MENVPVAHHAEFSGQQLGLRAGENELGAGKSFFQEPDRRPQPAQRHAHLMDALGPPAPRNSAALLSKWSRTAGEDGGDRVVERRARLEAQRRRLHGAVGKRGRRRDARRTGVHFYDLSGRRRIWPPQRGDQVHRRRLRARRAARAPAAAARSLLRGAACAAPQLLPNRRLDTGPRAILGAGRMGCRRQCVILTTCWAWQKRQRRRDQEGLSPSRQENHPDHNKTDPKAKERFAEVNSAYEIIGDETKKGQFDRGEIAPTASRRVSTSAAPIPSAPAAPSAASPARAAGAGRAGRAFRVQFRRRGRRAGGFDASELFGDCSAPASAARPRRGAARM